VTADAYGNGTGTFVVNTTSAGPSPDFRVVQQLGQCFGEPGEGLVGLTVWAAPVAGRGGGTTSSSSSHRRRRDDDARQQQHRGDARAPPRPGRGGDAPVSESDHHHDDDDDPDDGSAPDYIACATSACAAAAAAANYTCLDVACAPLCFVFDAAADSVAAGVTALPCTYGGASIARADPAFTDNAYWRGRIWGPQLQILYWALQRYAHIPAAAAARQALVAQSKSLLLRNWAAFNQVPENYNAVIGAAEDGAMADPFYHWGALAGSISLENARLTGCQPGA
jgi:hypothetical protein